MKNSELELQAICYSKRGNRIAKFRAIVFYAMLEFLAIILIGLILLDFNKTNMVILITGGIIFFLPMVFLVFIDDNLTANKFWLKKVKPFREEIVQWIDHKKYENKNTIEELEKIAENLKAENNSLDEEYLKITTN